MEGIFEGDKMNGWALSGSLKCNHHWQSGRRSKSEEYDLFKAYSNRLSGLTVYRWQAGTSESDPSYANYGRATAPTYTTLRMFLITKGIGKIQPERSVNTDPITTADNWFKGVGDYYQIDIKGEPGNPEDLIVYVPGFLIGSKTLELSTLSGRTDAYAGYVQSDYLKWGDGITSGITSQLGMEKNNLEYSDDTVAVKVSGNLVDYTYYTVGAYQAAESYSDLTAHTAKGFLFSDGITIKMQMKGDTNALTVNRLALACDMENRSFYYDGGGIGYLPCFESVSDFSYPFTIKVKDITENEFNSGNA